MRILSVLLFFVGVSGFAQTVLVDDASYSSSELVNVLLDEACLEVTNVSISSNEAVAYFNNQGGNFPLDEGVVIRSGKAKFSEGLYTGLNLSSQLNSNSDPYLVQLNTESGQSPLINDVAYMEFEFVPLSSEFTFDFLFASNEYGQWQCVSSDVFAFLLTDLTTGETTNLAVIEGTDHPVSIRNIKNNAYNSTCESDNPELFSTYNVNDPGSSTINMRGYTVVMNASTEIHPGNPYKIRLAIGDSNDGAFDSAIFLSAGSFNTNLDLGDDTMICEGDVQVLETGLDPLIYQHSWTRNGVAVPGENGNSLTVDQTGTYEVSVTKNNTNCLITDEIVLSDLMVETPMDLTECHTGSLSYTYDLTMNDESVLGVDDDIYDLHYYASMIAVGMDTPIPQSNLGNFSSSGDQTIFIRLINTETGQICSAVYDFQLLVNDPIVVADPDPIEICAAPGNSVVDLTQVEPEILNGQNPSGFILSYFESELDADNNVDAIGSPSNFTAADQFQIWVRVEDAQMANCYATTNFEININPLPLVDELEDVIECSEYILPDLTYGSYYTESGGLGQQLFSGDIITESGTYYIYNGPDANGCSNESDFEVHLASEFSLDLTHCGEFSIPNVLVGAFYTAPGGAGVTGTLLAPGTEITSSQTIYYYVEIDGEFCRDQPFDITILPLPPVDDPADVVTCGQYVLPPLTHGTYSGGSNGNGANFEAGDVITSSRNIYVFADDGTCTNQKKFRVTIVPEFSDMTVCGSYELPEVPVGGFYTMAGGQGEQIPEGSLIESTQTIFYYAETTTLPNCTENTSFQITVVPIPEVDSLNDVLLCEGEFYTLPSLTNGQYFSASGRQGDRLSPGDIISETQQIFINNLENGCDNETNFTVEIRPLPQIENFTDIPSCEPFALPTLTHGRYYTQSGGNGTELFPGDLIDFTQTIYIYNNYDDLTSCYSESQFTIYYNGIDVEQMDDVAICDEYELPVLSVGNYFTESMGQGTALYPGDVITESQEIFVFGVRGDRFACFDETSFFVEISQTPVLDDFGNVESCGDYTLPSLSQDEFNVGYYWDPNGQNEISTSEYTISEPGIYTIHVFATSKTNPDCFAETKFELQVFPLLELNIEGGTLCRNLETGEIESPFTLYSGLDPAEFTVNWFLDGNLVFTGPTYPTYEPGIYTVETVKLRPELGASCNYAPTTVEVKESARPIISAKVTEPFADIAVITVHIAQGEGVYEYQLNNGPFQESNEFYDVPSGSHTVKVRGVDAKCGVAVLEVQVLHYPKFFTPNGDGINDTWNIKDLWDHPEAKIMIFDRYGKHLASFQPRSEGWDGSYQGKPMFSSEYWFQVEFKENGNNKVFKAHFVLKR